MNLHLAYEPVMPGEEFTTTALFDNGAVNGSVELIVPEDIELLSDGVQKIGANKVSWTLKGSSGEYLLEYKYEENTYTRQLLITNEKNYKPIDERIKNSKLKSLKIDNNPVKILNLYIFGWKLGWLGTYIVFVIIFSTLSRKLLKVS